MKRVSIKAIISLVWVSAVSIAGLALNLHSLSGWTGLAAVAILPLFVMTRRWNDPRQSISQSIQEALR